MASEFQDLIPEKITATIQQLTDRIQRRFPGSSLLQIGQRLLQISQYASARARQMERPHVLLRTLGGGAIALIIGAIVFELYAGFTNWGIEVIDSTMNVIVLGGVAVFFCLSLETRYKRKQALAAIHELRAVAHIIDMHQLTKDPERVVEQSSSHALLPISGDTALLTRFELGRYLDYCSEMLSLTGKIAALYVQRFDDPVVITAVNEVETLCTGLSRKIWQKIMIIQANAGRQLHAPDGTQQEIAP